MLPSSSENGGDDSRERRLGRAPRSSTRRGDGLVNEVPGVGEARSLIRDRSVPVPLQHCRGKFDQPFASINDAPEFMASRRGNMFVGELDPRVDDLASPIGDASG